MTMTMVTTTTTITGRTTDDTCRPGRDLAPADSFHTIRMMR